MGRVQRIYYQNAVYHVMARGNNRRNILMKREYKMSLLESVSKYQKSYQFKIFGFVLMNNHVHLLIETHESYNISRVMQGILLSFSVKFRKRENYVGHVWQGRFKCKVIMNEPYIKEVLHYIHQNPVKAEITQKASDYLWSSSLFYDGENNPLIDDKIKITAWGTLLS